MIQQRKRFFSSSADGGPPDTLPLSSSSGHSTTSCSSIGSSGNLYYGMNLSDHVEQPAAAVPSSLRQYNSPPSSLSSSSTTNTNNNNHGLDFSRYAPNRALSMSIVRQKPGGRLSLSPKQQRRQVSATSGGGTVLPMSHSSSSSRPSYNHCNSTASEPQQQSYRHDCHYNNHNNHNNHNNYYNPMLVPTKNATKKSIYNNSHQHHSSDSLSVICTTVMVMGMVVMVVLTLSAHQHNGWLQQELHYKAGEIEVHVEHQQQLERRVQMMRMETQQLQTHVNALQDLTKEPSRQELALQRQVFQLQHARELVQQGIQESAKLMVQETFGPGPHYYVEIKLQYHPQSNIVQDAATELGDTIIVETASIEDMPHSIHLFLEQVQHGMWDGTFLYKNAPHLIQVGPHSNEAAQERFDTLPSLAHLLFPEYSANMPHVQYTLGYSTIDGQPGTVEFYINLQDNTQRHGPLGRTSQQMDADPCFARVLEGFSTLERIHRANVMEDNLNVRHTHHNIMVHPVVMESVRILTQYPPLPPNEQEQLPQRQE